MKRLVIIASLILVGCDPYAAREVTTGESTFTADEVQSMARNICKDDVPEIKQIATVRRAANIPVEMIDYQTVAIAAEDVWFAYQFDMCEEWVLDPLYPPLVEKMTEFVEITNKLYAYKFVEAWGKKPAFQKAYKFRGIIVNHTSNDQVPPIVEITLNVDSYHYGDYIKTLGTRGSHYFDFEYDYDVIAPRGTIELKEKFKTDGQVNGHTLAFCVKGNYTTPYNSYRYIESKDYTCTPRIQFRKYYESRTENY